MPDTDTDESLLERARAGDEEAFLSIYMRHRVSMYRFACRLLSGDAAAAEDVTHDCFLSLFRHPERFDPARGASLRTYLFAAVRNLSLKRFRHASREALIDSVACEQSAPAAEQPLGRMLEAESAAAVRAAVESLPPLQREVLILFDFEELSVPEVALVVGAEVNTVKSRLARARAGVRRALAPRLACRAELVGAPEK